MENLLIGLFRLLMIFLMGFLASRAYKGIVEREYFIAGINTALFVYAIFGLS